MAIAWLDLTLPTPEDNLALDEALLLEAETGRGGELLRIWEWPKYAVVLGAGGKLAEVDEAACAADGVPILRRASGGGTVLLGRGCLLFSLVLRMDRDPALRDINASYRYILGRVCNAFRPVAESEHAGTSDLAVGGRKVSGNAQQRKREHLLHHGTLLYAFELALLGRYLRMPERQPEYRHCRGHEEFVMNLLADAETLRRLLREEWDAGQPLTALPMDRTAELVREKYGRKDCVFRR